MSAPRAPRPHAEGARAQARAAQAHAELPDPLVDLDPLIGWCRGKRLVVIAGAGCSTESGIPDYRGPIGSKRERSPILFHQFVRSEEMRKRYWARSAIGWPVLRATAPNPTHYALAELERAGVVAGLITQNVDRLHQRAGSRKVVELHGALDCVRCLSCNVREERSRVQGWLLERNAHLHALLDLPVDEAPDGDAVLDESAYAAMRIPACAACGGVLKPDVVFFGENVPPHVVDSAWGMLDDADAVLVVGSSLTVWSGFRFVRKAARRGQPVGIVTLGSTRADGLEDLRVDARSGRVVPALVNALVPSPSAAYLRATRRPSEFRAHRT